jgi:protein TonB
MEPNQIKDAHILDILFEGRNKEYGAYDLRMTYNRRIVKAMVFTGGLIGLLFVGSYVSGLGTSKKFIRPIVQDVDLLAVKEPDKPLPPPPPPPKAPPQVKTVIFTPPKIVKDEQVKPDEKPPENKDIDDAKIGTVNTAGVADGDIVGPPVASGAAAGVVEAPKKADDDAPFTRVEIDASFPGGMTQWARFLNKNLRYPDEAINQGIGGTVMVQFVVDLDGNVSDVKAISGPETGGLREEAERVIKKSGKWVPAIQNGRHVKAYRRQPVTFQPPQEN